MKRLSGITKLIKVLKHFHLLSAHTLLRFLYTLFSILIVLSIGVSHQRWLPRTLLLSAQHPSERDRGEERVLLQLLHVSCTTTYSVSGRRIQQSLQHITTRGRQMRWISDICTQYLSVGEERFGGDEGRMTHHHLVDENTERPYVHTLSILLSSNEFWRKIVGCAA